MRLHHAFQFVVSKREVLLRGAELEGPWLREREDVDEDEFEEVQIGHRRGRWLYLTHDVWAEVQLADGWTAAYRVGLDRHGHPVIAEIRLFPTEPWRPNHYDGRWSAEVLGSRAQAPRGGITQRVIRAVPTRHFARVLNQVMAHVQRHQTSPLGRAMLGRFETPFQNAAPARTPVRSASRTPRRGRPPLADLAYATVAAAYVDAIDTNSRSPAKDVARALRQDERRTRAMIQRARARGFLSAAPRPGAYGGSLTAKARRVLRRHTRGQTSTPRQQPGGAS